MSQEPELLLKTSRFSVVQQQISVAGGTARKEYIVHPGAVTMIPLLEGERVCLIRNFRIAVGKTMVELPAGTIDPGEEPLQTAQRELQEETGYIASQWRQLPSFAMSPGILDERMHLFVATDLTPGEPQRQADEQIDNLVVGWKDAIEMALSGQIEDAKTLAGLLLWDRLRQRGMDSSNV
jgi:ADP-ribose diphosphatase